jgi:hypothetical protein
MLEVRLQSVLFQSRPQLAVVPLTSYLYQPVHAKSACAASAVACDRCQDATPVLLNAQVKAEPLLSVQTKRRRSSSIAGAYRDQGAVCGAKPVPRATRVVSIRPSAEFILSPVPSLPRGLSKGSSPTLQQAQDIARPTLAPQAHSKFCGTAFSGSGFEDHPLISRTIL